jgi:hypothetical protein
MKYILYLLSNTLQDQMQKDTGLLRINFTTARKFVMATKLVSFDCMPATATYIYMQANT